MAKVYSQVVSSLQTNMEDDHKAQINKIYEKLRKLVPCGSKTKKVVLHPKKFLDLKRIVNFQQHLSNKMYEEPSKIRTTKDQILLTKLKVLSKTGI